MNKQLSLKTWLQKHRVAHRSRFHGAVQTSSITYELLDALFRGKIDGIRISNFIEKSVANILFQEIMNNSMKQNYHHEIRKPDGSIEYLDYNVDRVGPVRNHLFRSEAKEKDFQNYSEQGFALMKRFRDLIPKNKKYPIDQLLDALAKAWPYGAQFDHVAPNIKAYAGVGRITRPGKNTRLSEEPHKDRLPDGLAYHVQVGVNIYLSLPHMGGEIILWDEKNGVPAGKAYSIHPKIRDLILIRTDHFHSVNGFEKGNRVTLSCFMGMNEKESLKLWS